MQAEFRITREQLLFLLTETWDSLLNWTLPNERGTRRPDINQPRTATLEVTGQKEGQDKMAAIAQAMLQVNMLQVSLTCVRVLPHKE